MMNTDWCGRDECRHCQGYDYGPKGSPDCPMVVCTECGGEVYNPPGTSEGHRKCKSCGLWYDKI